MNFVLITTIGFPVPFSTGIEDLCTKRDELHRQITTEEEEKNKIQNDIRILTERLAKITESLSKKYAAQSEYDKTIAETETAYMKVCLAIVSSVSQHLQLFTSPYSLSCRDTG